MRVRTFMNESEGRGKLTKELANRLIHTFATW